MLVFILNKCPVLSEILIKIFFQGAKAQQKRERATKGAPKEAKSSLKINEQAKNIQCEICKQTFVSHSVTRANDAFILCVLIQLITTRQPALVLLLLCDLFTLTTG